MSAVLHKSGDRGSRLDDSLDCSGYTLIAWLSAKRSRRRPLPVPTCSQPIPPCIGTLIMDGAGSTCTRYRRNR